jgi:chromosome partitioning protein
MKKIIAVVNQKGGCGKTTTSVNFASGLARHGHRTLLIDLDPQAHSTAAVGFAPGSYSHTIHDVLVNNRNIRETIKETAIENLYLVPSHLKLSRGEQLLNSGYFKEGRLHKAIRNLDYNFIIIDCRPDLGTLTVNALYACNFILVPVEMAPFSLDGFGDLLETIENVNNSEGTDRDKPIRVLLTKYLGTEKKINEWVLKELEGYKGLLFETIIRRTTDIPQSQAINKPIFQAAPKSNAAIDYEKLTMEFLNLCHHLETN